MNKYVPRFLPAEVFARQTTTGISDPLKRYKLLTNWMTHNVAYDYVKAMRVAKVKGVAPDPVSCWATHRGICQDIASLTAILLRAVGIQAYLCIGHADGNYHAWVQAYISGKVYRYDHDGRAKVYRLERKY